MRDAKQGAEAESSDVVGAVRRGTRWVFAAQIASQVISLAALAILCRLIRPEEYGLFAAAWPAVLLPRMAATLGLSTAVLQERSLSQTQLSTLFLYTALLGLMAAATTAVCGPLLASAYEKPLLAPLCLALAGTSLVAALGNQHVALLERHLRLDQASAVRLLGQIAGSGAAIWAASRGAGVWALVAQQYGDFAVVTFWSWLLERWRPGWPGRLAAIRPLVRFSSFYSASQLVLQVARDLDKFLLPALLSATASDRALGLYAQASTIMFKPVYVLTSPLTGLMVSGLAQVRGDAVTHTALVARFYRLVGVLLWPCTLGLWAVAPDAMRVLAGVQWQDAGPILTALAPAMLAHGLINLSTHVLASAGRAGRLLLAMSLLCGLLACAGAVGMWAGPWWPTVAASGGPAATAAIGLAAGTSLALLGIWLVPYLFYCLSVAQVSPGPVLRALVPAGVSAAIMALTVAGLRQLPGMQALSPHARLVVLVAAGVALYTLLARRELAWSWRELVQRRSPLAP